MSDEAIGVGVMGCGARIRAVIDAVVKASPRVEVRAVYDPHPPSVQKTKERFNPNARDYSDLHDLVQDPEISWIMIGSWNCHQADQILAALDAGKLFELSGEDFPGR